MGLKRRNTALTDPLVESWREPIKRVKARGQQTFHRPIVPGMSWELECECLREIRAMGDNLVPWKVLPNGMTAGHFAYIYVYHYQEKCRARGK